MNEKTEWLVTFACGFVLGPLLLNISPFISGCFYWLGAFTVVLIIAYCILLACGGPMLDRRD